jgi:carboxyl-terminal processing protease
VVVGTNSYGKGTVQTVIRMPNDGELTLTWSRFHSPSGYALHGLGVLPTICTADERAQAVALLAPLRDGRSPFASTIAAWRAAPVDAAEQRKQLRTICPSAKHANLAIDVEVARDLIGDRNLLAHALSLTAPVATASSMPPVVAQNQH